jgi:hypothetical protein
MAPSDEMGSPKDTAGEGLETGVSRAFEVGFLFHSIFF